MKSTTMASMDLLAVSLIVVGMIMLIIGGVWFLVAAFRESVLWGLACLFVPIVQLFFLIVHWPEAKRPFLFQLLAIVLVIVAMFIRPQTFHH
jgi:hypothetical protein